MEQPRASPQTIVPPPTGRWIEIREEIDTAYKLIGPAPHGAGEPGAMFFRDEQATDLYEAFQTLDYRERDMLSKHLGVCPRRLCHDR